MSHPDKKPGHQPKGARPQSAGAAPGKAAEPKPTGKKEPITLAQYLKVVGVAENGGHAKALVREGQVTVNGEAENRPARKLAPGDKVKLGDDEFVVDR